MLAPSLCEAMLRSPRKRFRSRPSEAWLRTWKAGAWLQHSKICLILNVGASRYKPTERNGVRRGGCLVLTPVAVVPFLPGLPLLVGVRPWKCGLPRKPTSYTILYSYKNEKQPEGGTHNTKDSAVF